VLARPPGGQRKIFNSKRGPQPKKFGNRWAIEVTYAQVLYLYMQQRSVPVPLTSIRNVSILIFLLRLPIVFVNYPRFVTQSIGRMSRVAALLPASLCRTNVLSPMRELLLYSRQRFQRHASLLLTLRAGTGSLPIRAHCSGFS